MRTILSLLTVSTLMLTTQTSAEEKQRTEARVFKKTPQGELKIHLHFPADWKKTDKRPAIVFFFGGGWRKGKVTQFQTQAEYLATRGMVTARADYRVSSRHKTKPDACVEDCKSAVRWLRANAKELGIDPERIVSSGGSAGGHTAACTAIVKGFDASDEDEKVSSKPNLLALFNPALDTAQFGDRFGSDDLAKKMSPVHNLTKDVPPAIIFFGTNDKLLAGAKDYLKQAEPLKLEAELYLAKGQPHGFFNRSPWREVTLNLLDQFLVKHGYLEGKATLKVPVAGKMERFAK